QKTSKINGIRVGWIEPEQQYLGLMNPVEVKYWSENDQSYCQSKMESSTQDRLQFQNQNPPKTENKVKRHFLCNICHKTIKTRTSIK
nr:hypothetical protein [Endozoicomonas sp.]